MGVTGAKPANRLLETSGMYPLSGLVQPTKTPAVGGTNCIPFKSTARANQMFVLSVMSVAKLSEIGVAQPVAVKLLNTTDWPRPPESLASAARVRANGSVNSASEAASMVKLVVFCGEVRVTRPESWSIDTLHWPIADEALTVQTVVHIEPLAAGALVLYRKFI